MKFERNYNFLKAFKVAALVLFVPILIVAFILFSIEGLVYVILVALFAYLYYNHKVLEANESVFKILLHDDYAEIHYSKEKMAEITYNSMRMAVSYDCFYLISENNLIDKCCIFMERDWDDYTEILDFLLDKNIKKFKLTNRGFGI
ncbi:hypothetical protein [Aureispira anguillae]|uniref:Uncharacterized protein n=1 Tax=Aureispira anguillae TaxID=2864201 RepID=A0A915YCT7_9BACT|nr:hypothetical protein [Aureispira anguillae]BDS10693.1 hypothetical protein AsAng_0014020 [Aureispira anguillae]